ncbi:hypothetical protein MMPV_002438 [Pyropia vietnamensis]
MSAVRRKGRPPPSTTCTPPDGRSGGHPRGGGDGGSGDGPPSGGGGGGGSKQQPRRSGPCARAAGEGLSVAVDDDNDSDGGGSGGGTDGGGGPTCVEWPAAAAMMLALRGAGDLLGGTPPHTLGAPHPPMVGWEPLAPGLPSGTPPPSIFIEKVTRVLRSKRVSEHARLTITDRDVGHIHFDSSPTHLFLVIAATSLPQRGAFKLLAELMRDFVPPAQTPAEAWGASAASEDLLATVVKRHNGRSPQPVMAAGTDSEGGPAPGDYGKEPVAREISLASSSSTTLSTLTGGARGGARTSVSVDFPSEWEKGVLAGGADGGDAGADRVVSGDKRRALEAAAIADARGRRMIVIAVGVGALLILVGGPMLLWK